MDLGLDGRRALVGGGGSGLGGGIAGALVGEGARVALIGRTQERIEGEASRLGGIAGRRGPRDARRTGRGGRCRRGRARRAGPARRQLGRPARRHVRHRSPRPTGRRRSPARSSRPLRLIRAALPHLRESDVPSILVVLSSSVREPIPALITSNVLRPGLVGLIKSLQTEIAPVRINGIAPGRVSTDRIAWLDGKRAEAAGVTRRGDRAADEGDHPARAVRRAGRGRPRGRRSCCRPRRRS